MANKGQPQDIAPPQGELSGFSDLDYIRQYVPIEEVAEFFGFDVHNHTMRCFRPEKHQHGDRTPSFQFYKNNRAQCFCCDAHAYSNIDFAKLVLGCETWPAIQWISQRFPNLPRARIGRPHGTRRREQHVHVGIYGGQLEDAVRSGLYGKLSWPARALLPVLIAVQNENGQVKFAYNTLLRLTGIGSAASLKKGLTELVDLHAITVRKVPRSDAPGTRNVYSSHLRASRVSSPTSTLPGAPIGTMSSRNEKPALLIES